MTTPFNPFEPKSKPASGPSTPSAITEAQRKHMAASIAIRLKARTAATLVALKAVQNDGIDAVWGNETISAQDVFDALGDDGYKLNEMHRMITKVLVDAAALYSTPDTQIDPGIKLPTNAMTYSPEGKATVTDQPYVPA